jgi:CubicO group peptidase (beta-lactamase class C family)
MNWKRITQKNLMITLVVACAFAAFGQESPAAKSSIPADAPSASADELVGLWKAKRRYGPDARGPLIIRRESSGWTADFLGRTFPIKADGSELSFVLADDQGSFSGKLQPGDGSIAGHWTPPRSVIHGARYAGRIVLKADGANRWRGNVVPRDDDFTLYLMVQKRPDGTVGAFLRNPERNIGVPYDVDHIVREGNDLKLIGKLRGAPGVVLSGVYDPENNILCVFFPNRGGTYDFRRDDDEQSGFYPRGKNPGRYLYQPPLTRDDGWPTRTLEEVGINRAGIEKFIQRIIDMPIESVHTPELEGILIARHGKLVLEEYFHGEHRDKLHDTRSAGKSLTATMVGAVIQAGAPLTLSTPVYQIMNGGTFPANLDPRKREMTLEHLLMMRAGFYCNDSDPDAPGNEDILLDQTDDPDYYRYSLKVPMATAPGETSVYCSMMPNLALGVVNRATGEPLMDTFDRLIGGPMQWGRYAWYLDPAGNPYGGGSIQILPRDYMKLGQLMLNGGTWHGRRILSRDFVTRASSPLHDLNHIQYGYLWWSINYPYKNRSVRAFFAGGNGGQLVMVVPDLDLVIATYAGNYADKVGLQIQQDYVPNYILPAVRELGDDKSAPVVQKDFHTPYGHPPVVKTK